MISIAFGTRCRIDLNGISFGNGAFDTHFDVSCGTNHIRVSMALRSSSSIKHPTDRYVTIIVSSTQKKYAPSFDIFLAREFICFSSTFLCIIREHFSWTEWAVITVPIKQYRHVRYASIRYVSYAVVQILLDLGKQEYIYDSHSSIARCGIF